jgi:hypothetical protein
MKLSGETSAQFAEKVKPENSEVIHLVVETDVWQTAQKCIIAFYQVAKEGLDDVYVYVYYPLDSLSYKSIRFGPIEGEGNSAAEILSVFFVNADQDTHKELAVLCAFDFDAYDVAGTFYYTYIFDGPTATDTELNHYAISSKFDDADYFGMDRPESEQKGRKEIAKFKTAKAIRAELKRLGY